MRHKLLSILLALVLLALTPASASAYRFTGGYLSVTNPAGLGDGWLNVCFENDPVWTGFLQGVVQQGVLFWLGPLYLNFNFQAFNCNNANIRFLWENLGPCGTMEQAAYAEPPTVNDTYVEVTFNSACTNWTWTTTGPIAPGYIDAHGHAARLTGRALGLGWVLSPYGPGEHPVLLMNPYNCTIGYQTNGLAQNDADGIRNRYPTLANWSASFPNFAPCAD